MGIFGRIISSYAESSTIKDAEQLLTVCRSYGPKERGGLFAATKIALAFMVLDREYEERDSILIMLDAMESGRELTTAEKAQLSGYNIRLMKLQSESHKSTSQINNIVATGLPIWITSNRALMQLSLQPHIRELWSILESGDSFETMVMIDEVIRHLGDHPLVEKIERARGLSIPDAFRAR